MDMRGGRVGGGTLGKGVRPPDFLWLLAVLLLEQRAGKRLYKELLGGPTPGRKITLGYRLRPFRTEVHKMRDY